MRQIKTAKLTADGRKNSSNRTEINFTFQCITRFELMAATGKTHFWRLVLVFTNFSRFREFCFVAYCEVKEMSNMENHLQMLLRNSEEIQEFNSVFPILNLVIYYILNFLFTLSMTSYESQCKHYVSVTFRVTHFITLSLKISNHCNLT